MRRACVLLLPLIGSLAVACTGDRTSPSAGQAGAVAVVPAPADTDDFGAPLPRDARFAERVVSLNPSATEAIYAIGAESHLVGRSRWDKYPAQVENVPALGDGIRPAVEPILAANPTLVVLYATAENRAAAQALARAGVRTIALRVDRIAQFHAQLRALGVALGAPQRAVAVSDSVQRTLDRVRALTTGRPRRPTVVWPVWNSPPMVIGGGSYMDELLEIAGARNVFHEFAQPSPTVSMEEVIARNPERVIVSAAQAEELSRNEGWRAVDAVRAKRFILHDPVVTGRPSVVLGMAAVQLARALHPALADSLRDR